MKLAGKRAVVTGSSHGLGLEIARTFVSEGASVVLCGRGEGDIVAARDSLIKTRPSKEQSVLAMRADVSRQSDVEALADYVKQQLGGLDTLVCNAGVYGPKGPFSKTDWQSWVAAVNINLFGLALSCKTFIPLLERSDHAKIILLSGGGATKPLPNLSSYATSKAAVVRFGETLAEELQECGIDVNMVAPGALNTRLLDEILEAGPDVVGAAFYESAKKQKETGGTPLDRGAALCLFLASDASTGITGKLISAVWDPWETFPELRSVLADSDVYTLRRIVPEERGFTW